MEAGSEGDSDNFNGRNSPSGMSKRPKRQMKTPFQLEILEKTYALETYPSEATRAELSEKLGLTDRQLQMWFCHKRLKDKKEAAGAVKQRVIGVVGRKGMLESPRDELMVTQQGSDRGSGSGSKTSQFDYEDDEHDVPMVPKRFFESPQSVMHRRVIACVEAQLGEPIREDGPILGSEFDELPPGAFGAPIVMAEHQDRSVRSYDRTFELYDTKRIKAAMSGFLEPAEPNISSDAYGRVVSSYMHDSPVDGSSARTSAVAQGDGLSSRVYGVQGQVLSVGVLPHREKQGIFSSPLRDNECIPHDEDVLRMERKCKDDEASTEREVPTHEKRIRKELDKQDLLRRKMEDQMRKEMEKQDRERRKEEEKMLREKQRQEERLQREEKREMERREKFLQKELLKAERRRQKEGLRSEREAARLKAAIERATSRKIAKESMELIEDDRLELMELAVSSKGLPSIISLDYDTLQNLETFRDSLCAFPPKSVELKRPFAIQPWIDSEDNIGNLLVVWRFCIAFADVLGLWPFTLDEFVQAFHDYDSRLLGEIHIALLKLIIKDIEDVARTPFGGSGTNQYSAANLEGGHPQIVEGAYMWGFDIGNWQKRLNPLTWPEILRQFALSAGLGPHLKKKSTERACFLDNDEVKGCEDVISTLRNGSAAENAAAIMQEKRFPLQRRSRHRLTPGTVKFAAYHVLSLEGSDGLMVVEIADKIQKSGLRDLTTSKTPEASISVALSRDPVLFERIAPSTYCIRPAFRKDPANAEAILSAAREKIHKYVNGFLAGENADDVEREDDSESDVAEGPEVDDLGTSPNANKTGDHCNEVSTCSGNAKDNLSGDVSLNLQNELDSAGIGASNPDQEDTEIDESRSGELWVQGLAEGEYSDLCVEERLNALFSLTSIVNEGNTVRAVLEDRLDAANAIKKQMWAEAQLDKRRIKEDGIPKFHDSSFAVAVDGGQSPLPTETLPAEIEEEPSMGPVNVQNHLSSLSAEKSLEIHDTSTSKIRSPIQQNGYATERSRLQLKTFISHRAEEMFVYRSLPLGQDRRRNRYWKFVASASRHDPGSGRIFVESPDGYWRLIDSQEAFDTLLMSLDTRGIRESHLLIMLQKIEMSFKENVRGKSQHANIVDQAENEAAEMGSSPPYTAGADSPSSALCSSNSETWEPSSSFRIELGRNETEKKNALKRYGDLQKWMWKECFNVSALYAMRYGKKRCMPLLGICDFCLDSYNFEDDLCPSCHGKLGTFHDKLNFLEQVFQCEEKTKINTKDLFISDSSHPLRIRLLKTLLIFLEVSVPYEALRSSWTEDRRKSWGLRLRILSSIEDLLQILTQFEGAIKRDYLSSNFETTEELLVSCVFPERAVCVSANPGYVPQLPWIPQTSAAVALRLLELDASIFYTLHQRAEPRNEKKVDDITKLPSMHKHMKRSRKVSPTELNHDEHNHEDNWKDLGSIPSRSRSRQRVIARGGRIHGKWQRRVAGSISESGRRSVRGNVTLSQVLRQQEQRAHGRGRRTVRRRRTEKKMDDDDEMHMGHLGDKGSLNSVAESPRNFNQEEWVGEDSGNMQIADDDNSNSTDENDSDDNADAIRYGNGRVGPSFAGDTNTSTMDLMETSDEDADGTEDDENSEGDIDMNDGSDRNGDEDEGTDSLVSGDYSD